MPIQVIYCILVFLQLQVPIYTAYLYDAVMVYARAVDEVLREGGSQTNGTAILAKIRSRTFTSKGIQ